MKIDSWIRGSLRDAAHEALAIEELGFDGAFSFEGSHEPFMPIALAAEHTQHIQLMTNIAVGFARSPLDLAQVANDLQTLSAGRFALGVGSQIRPHIQNRFSMPWSRPVERMGELVQAIKAVQTSWETGGRPEWRGDIYELTLMTPFFSPGPNPFGPPPVYVAALGPRMTAKAAEVADGLLVHPFNTEHFVREHTADAVSGALQRAGRERRDFTIAVTAIMATWSTEQEMTAALEGVRRLLAFYGSTPAYRVVLDAHGEGELQTELNSLSKQGRWEEMSALVDDGILGLLAVCGSPAEVAAQTVHRYLGVADRVSYSTPYPIGGETTAAVLAELRGALAGARGTGDTRGPLG